MAGLWNPTVSFDFDSLSNGLEAWIPEVSAVLARHLALVISVPLCVCATASVPLQPRWWMAACPGGWTGLSDGGSGYKCSDNWCGTRCTGWTITQIYLTTVILGSSFWELFDGFDSSIEVGHVHEHQTLWARCRCYTDWLLGYFAVEELNMSTRNLPKKP